MLRIRKEISHRVRLRSPAKRAEVDPDCSFLQRSGVAGAPRSALLQSALPGNRAGAEAPRCSRRPPGLWLEKRPGDETSGRQAGKVAPAILRRALLVLCFLGAAAASAAPANPAPDLSQLGKPGAAEAARILEHFRSSGITGEHYLEFALHALPRQGEEKVFRGRLWGGRNEQGTVNRVELTDADGRTHRLLVQNGEHAAVWRVAGGRVVPMEMAELFAPVIPGVDLTAFDLQMPFLYWPQATLESINRVRGRPAHAFLFRAPATFSAPKPGVAAARAYLDTQYNALMQTELIGGDGRVLKSFSLIDLKKVGEQWLPKSADFRNAVTRDKTRFQVPGAALNLALPAEVFEPAGLAAEARPPAVEKITRIEP